MAIKDKISKPERHIKCVNFDLSTEKILKHFPNGTAKPYESLKQFFLDKGFEHRQYSNYISKEPIDDYDFSQILEIFARKHIWLKDCLQSFDILNVENKRKIDATKQICNAIQKAQQKESQIQKSQEQVKESSKKIYLKTKIKTKNKDLGFEM